MTSYREGSPQVVKEALECGTPIVSVDVGDVREVTAGIEGCYITSYDVHDVAHAIDLAFSFRGKTTGHQCIIERGLSNDMVTKRIVEIYNSVLKTQ